MLTSNILVRWGHTNAVTCSFSGVCLFIYYCYLQNLKCKIWKQSKLFLKKNNIYCWFSILIHVYYQLLWHDSCEAWGCYDTITIVIQPQVFRGANVKVNTWGIDARIWRQVTVQIIICNPQKWHVVTNDFNCWMRRYDTRGSVYSHRLSYL